jgi:hypothetical protein
MVQRRESLGLCRGVGSGLLPLWGVWGFCCGCNLDNWKWSSRLLRTLDVYFPTGDAIDCAGSSGCHPSGGAHGSDEGRHQSIPSPSVTSFINHLVVVARPSLNSTAVVVSSSYIYLADTHRRPLSTALASLLPDPSPLHFPQSHYHVCRPSPTSPEGDQG